MLLKQRFYDLISTYTNDKNLKESLWIEINACYIESHRSYHNLTHLSELFAYFDFYEEQIMKPDLISFSIFYHDIVYNIWKKDNEEKSALLAIERLAQVKLNSEELDSIHEQIIATKNHGTMHHDTKWLIDFDLGILGKSPEVYSNYAKLIRKEYKRIPNILYKRGRKKVLQHFINKPFIYATQEFRSIYEKQAKINLTNELKAL